MNKDIFYSSASNFLDRLFSILEEKEFKLRPEWDIDHICYRASSQSEYEILKANFSEFGDLLVESIVNGRLISTFKLHKGLVYKAWIIELVELPAPKTGKTTPAGFEHIEVVADQAFEDFRHAYPSLNWETKGLEKNFNKELELHLGERNLKFHHLSLESVIRLEVHQTVWKLLDHHKLLEDLKSFSPFVLGDYALGRVRDDSELTILLTANSKDEFSNYLRPYHPTYKDSNNAIEASFLFEGLKVRLIATKSSYTEHPIFKDFSILEKNLKYKQE